MQEDAKKLLKSLQREVNATSVYVEEAQKSAMNVNCLLDKISAIEGLSEEDRAAGRDIMTVFARIAASMPGIVGDK